MQREIDTGPRTQSEFSATTIAYPIDVIYICPGATIALCMWVQVTHQPILIIVDSYNKYK